MIVEKVFASESFEIKLVLLLLGLTMRHPWRKLQILLQMEISKSVFLVKHIQILSHTRLSKYIEIPSLEKKANRH